MIDIPDSFFSKNEKGEALCPRCQETLPACECPSFDPTKPKADRFSPSLRLDRSGRKGKVVTLVRALPRDEAYLKELSKTIKMKTGSGGTTYCDEEGGVLEVQGDQRARVEDILRQEKFRRKL